MNNSTNYLAFYIDDKGEFQMEMQLLSLDDDELNAFYAKANQFIADQLSLGLSLIEE